MRRWELILLEIKLGAICCSTARNLPPSIWRVIDGAMDEIIALVNAVFRA